MLCWLLFNDVRPQECVGIHSNNVSILGKTEPSILILKKKHFGTQCSCELLMHMYINVYLSF